MPSRLALRAGPPARSACQLKTRFAGAMLQVWDAGRSWLPVPLGIGAGHELVAAGGRGA